jgi:hypothetical protein
MYTLSAIAFPTGTTRLAGTACPFSGRTFILLFYGSQNKPSLNLKIDPE